MLCIDRLSYATSIAKPPTVFRLGIVLGCMLLVGFIGCSSQSTRNASKKVQQQVEDQQLQRDDLRTAMRRLEQMDPTNKEKVAKEVRIELNSWLQDRGTRDVDYSPSKLIQAWPKQQLTEVGSASPVKLQFGYWDIDYLFQCRLMRRLSSWIVDFPLRDELMRPLLEAKRDVLEPADAVKLKEAYKLFDWTIRNVALIEEGSSSVETKVQDPHGPIRDDGVGYGYLPWQTLLFSRGDFVERGRVFHALAQQRELDTFWIAVGAGPEEPGDLFAIGVRVAGDVFLFEPKLGMPILEPDEVRLATLEEARKNNRVMRRLDLPGRFDYAFEQSDLQSLQLLLDVPPVAISVRAKILESALLGENRMIVYRDPDAMRSRLEACVPNASIQLWRTPLLAQLQAISVSERLENPTPFAARYMAEHGVWIMDTPAARARLLHLNGQFENTLDTEGALSVYMETHVADDILQKLTYDPEIQQELGIRRMAGETDESHEARIRQAQYIYSQAKFDSAFTMAQLHYDRGNYESAENWLRKRVLGDDRASRWHAAAWYSLGRTYTEQGRLDEAAEAFAYQPSPQEAGNRLRERYLEDIVE